eukprot:222380-Pelagomonas_calceolata.AAC.1
MAMKPTSHRDISPGASPMPSNAGHPLSIGPASRIALGAAIGPQPDFFAAELPSGKLPAWDVAVVYLSPEILTAAREQKEGQVNRSAPVTPTQESDTFAFAK